MNEKFCKSFHTASRVTGHRDLRSARSIAVMRNLESTGYHVVMITSKWVPAIDHRSLMIGARRQSFTKSIPLSNIQENESIRLSNKPNFTHTCMLSGRHGKGHTLVADRLITTNMQLRLGLLFGGGLEMGRQFRITDR